MTFDTTEGNEKIIANKKITMENQNQLRFYDLDNSNYVAFKGCEVITSNITWSLPPSDGLSNQLLKTDGGGILSWTPREYILNVSIEDVSTSGDGYIVAPYTGKIIKIYSVINNSITVANANITVYIESAPSTNIVGSNLNIAYSGSGAGDKNTATITSNNTIPAGEYIRISTNNGSTQHSTGECKATYTIVIERT